MTMRVVNLTGHPVRLETDSSSILIQSDGQRARLVSRPHMVGEVKIAGLCIPLYVHDERRILDLPDPEAGTIYIVSGMVADVAQRDDVWAIGRKNATKGEVESGYTLIRWEAGNSRLLRSVDPVKGSDSKEEGYGSV